MQANELQLKLQESEKICSDNADKVSKLVTELDLMSTSLSEAESKKGHAVKTTEALESQLGEANALLEEETRQKLALNSKLRNLEQAKEAMSEQLEEEEESKRQLEKALADVKTQLGEAKRKA